MKFTIPIEPVAQMRARHSTVGGFSRTYKAPKQKANENRLLAFAVQYRPSELLICPLELIVDAYMPIPASMPKKKAAQARAGELRPDKKPDASNILKHVEDVFNGIFWKDDKQIVSATCRKFYSDHPRYEITIEPA
jgi:Holliday junction resolvase RusA-like endonuclease